MSAQAVTSPVLTGLFHEFMNQSAGRVGLQAAPVRRIDGLTAEYNILKTWSGLSREMGGYDPLDPISLHAPARPVTIDFDKRMFAVDRYAESAFSSDHERDHIMSGAGFEWSSAAVRHLANIHADRHNVKVAQILNNPANFGANIGAIDFTDPTDTVFQKIEAAANAVSSLAGAGRDGLVAVVNSATAAAMRAHPAFASAFASGSGFTASNVTAAALAQAFQDNFGIRLLVDSSVYRDNVTNPSAPVLVKTFSDSTFVIANVTPDSSQAPTFIHTVAKSSVTEADIAEIYTISTDNPRGTEVIAEAVYRVELVNAQLGYRIAATI